MEVNAYNDGIIKLCVLILDTICTSDTYLKYPRYRPATALTSLNGNRAIIDK